MKGKVVIVTGGGRGIGRAVCRRFATAGAKVVAAARTQEELAETKRAVEADGGYCLAVPTDVADAGSIDSLVAAAVRECGGVDVLVNNAGVACTGRIGEFDLADFDRMVAVNVGGVFYASRAVWPIMQERGGGVIVNISSMAAVDPFPGFAAYGATKNFVEGLTRSLAKEGKKCGIRVYAVGPGAVDTQMLRGPYPDFPADECLQPAEVAETVFMMTQSACRYSAGQTVYVNKT